MKPLVFESHEDAIKFAENLVESSNQWLADLDKCACGKMFVTANASATEIKVGDLHLQFTSPISSDVILQVCECGMARTKVKLV